jgi:hypothetical protein
LYKHPPGYRDAAGFFIRYVIPVLGDLIEVGVGVLLILMPTRTMGWVERLQESLERKLSEAERGDDESRGVTDDE